MKIICRKPSGRNCIAKEKKVPIEPKIFFPLPLESVKGTSTTPFTKSPRPRKNLSPARESPLQSEHGPDRFPPVSPGLCRLPGIPFREQRRLQSSDYALLRCTPDAVCPGC